MTIDRQFCLDMAAAHRKSTTAQNKAHAAAYEALAARLAPVPPVVVPPVVVPPAVSGRPFAAGSPFNTPTPATTTWRDESVLHTVPNGWDAALPAGTRVKPWVTTALPFYRAAPTDPIWTFDMGATNDPYMNRVRPAERIAMRAPATLAAWHPDDAVVIAIDGTKYVEVWNAIVDPVTRTVRSGNPARNNGWIGWAKGDVATGLGCMSVPNDGTRAANFSRLAGAITADDIARGRIDHALVIELPAYLLNAAPSGTVKWVPPATAYDNGWARGPILSGARIGIPAGVAKPALSGEASMLWDCLQTYGMFVGDFCGGPWPIFYVADGLNPNPWYLSAGIATVWDALRVAV